jgi:hypothetical protein
MSAKFVYSVEAYDGVTTRPYLTSVPNFGLVYAKALEIMATIEPKFWRVRIYRQSPPGEVMSSEIACEWTRSGGQWTAKRTRIGCNP